ncbi:hypothetical protein Tco_1381114 [Tanacetum coccineum]
MMVMIKTKTLLLDQTRVRRPRGEEPKKESVAEPTKEVIMDTSNDDVVNDFDQPQNDPAGKHNWFTQPPRPPTQDPE